MQRVLDAILRRQRNEPDIPECPEHKVQMSLRGKQGRPARFSDQSEEEYTLVYFCPIDGCNETAYVNRLRTQIPVPGQPPDRPTFARRR